MNDIYGFDSSLKIIKAPIKKTCYKCGIRKPIVDFHVRKQSPDGYETRCKECHKERQAAYRAERKPNYFI